MRGGGSYRVQSIGQARTKLCTDGRACAPKYPGDSARGPSLILDDQNICDLCLLSMSGLSGRSDSGDYDGRGELLYDLDEVEAELTRISDADLDVYGLDTRYDSADELRMLDRYVTEESLLRALRHALER